MIGYNRMRFLLTALADLDQQFKAQGGQLYFLQGKPSEIFRRLWEECAISTICYEQDCEPIWRERDSSVENLCHDIGVNCIEKISHTLWNPQAVIQANGGIPPLTYEMFLVSTYIWEVKAVYHNKGCLNLQHTVETLGLPPRPVPNPNWNEVKFFKLPEKMLKEFQAFSKVSQTVYGNENCVLMCNNFSLPTPRISTFISKTAIPMLLKRGSEERQRLLKTYVIASRLRKMHSSGASISRTTLILIFLDRLDHWALIYGTAAFL